MDEDIQLECEDVLALIPPRAHVPQQLSVETCWKLIKFCILLLLFCCPLFAFVHGIGFGR